MTSDAGSGGDSNADADATGNANTEFAVTREGTLLVTLHEGTDTTARSEATTLVTDALEELAASDALSVTDRTVGDAEVYEGPTAPFDPYTVAVGVSVTVVVSASDADAAEATGADAIDDALESAGLDGIRDASSSVALA